MAGPAEWQTTRRVLVLGSNGFLARHVVAALAGDVRTTPVRHARTPSRADAGCALDLAAAAVADVRALIETAQADAVVNCIGLAQGDEERMEQINVGLVAMLIEAVRATAVRRLVHLGSAAEYGPTPQGVSVDEQTPPHPVAAYGRTKLAGTELLRASTATGVDAVVLRVFNPVGPGMPLSSLPGRLTSELQRAIASGEMEIHCASLAAWRDFVDARDAATAVVAAVTTTEPLAPVFNVGRGEAVLSRTLAHHIASAAGFRGQLLEDDESLATRVAGVSWSQANINAIRRDLGWTARHSIRDAAQHLWRTAPDTMESSQPVGQGS